MLEDLLVVVVDDDDEFCGSLRTEKLCENSLRDKQENMRKRRENGSE